MKSTDKLHETNKMKMITYGVILALVFCWPWIFIGGVGEGDLVDALSLGLIPVIIISGIIAYRETKTRTSAYRGGFGVALAASFLLVWIIPAVGIFGRSGDPADLIYFGVLAVGVIGALIARFRPQGMARTLVAMVIAQMLVDVIGLTAGLGTHVILNGFFATLWLGSALLFRKAAQGKQNGTLYSHKIFNS